MRDLIRFVEMKVLNKISGGLMVAVPVLMLIFDSGCASTGPKLKRVTDAERMQVLSGSALSLDTARLQDPPDEDIIGLTDDMKAFVRHAISRYRGQGEKLKAILDAIISPYHLGLMYDGAASFTASETFERKRANCLSFTTMIVSMLRYAGLKVEFNDVDIPPVWDLQNNNMLVMYRHVNAVVTWPDGSREVVDFNLGEYNIHYPQHRIRDEIAIAQYYNNRGVEYLLQGKNVDAFRYLHKALDLAPEVPFFWINLGALYRNQGKLEAAEIAYRNALEIEPDNLVVISNAERIYKDLGLTELSEYFGRRVKYFRQRNPYYLYKLAMDSFLAGDNETALQNIHGAIRRYDEEHRFYFLQGVIYMALEETEQASTSFNMAIKLSSNRKQADKYRRKMEKLL
jgi:Tfp pilus assembly protein PilF